MWEGQARSNTTANIGNAVAMVATASRVQRRGSPSISNCWAGLMLQAGTKDTHVIITQVAQAVKRVELDEGPSAGCAGS